MVFVLLMLFALSLTITVAGYFLSSRTPSSNIRMRSREVSYYDRRQPYRGYRTAPQQRIRGYSSIPLRQQRAGVTLSPMAAIGRLFGGWEIGDPVPIPVTVVGLILIFFIGLYLLTIVLPRHALIGLVTFSGDTASSTTQASQSQNAPLPLIGASKALVRIGQLDPAQYNSSDEYNTWAMSACSAAAMTEVINAYGHHYRVTDILQVESSIHEITPDLGLLEDVGIARTVSHFGFTTNWGHTSSLDQIIAIANSGRPVIVSFPPDRYAGGHLLVVTGGDSNHVYLADSSIFNRRSLTRTQFMKWWEGFYAVVTPN